MWQQVLRISRGIYTDKLRGPIPRHFLPLLLASVRLQSNTAGSKSSDGFENFLCECVFLASGFTSCPQTNVAGCWFCTIPPSHIILAEFTLQVTAPGLAFGGEERRGAHL